MTRDEYRTKCIEMAAIGMHKINCSHCSYKSNLFPWEQFSELYRKQGIELATAAFDALHSIARVNPLEATEEMIDAAKRAHYSASTENINLRLWRAMSTTGDLTNESN